MFGNPAAERAALEGTYEDTMTVTAGKTVTEHNISRFEPETEYSDVRCSLSRNVLFRRADSSEQTDVSHRIEYDAVIFAAPELAVMPGDMIALKRFGRDQPESRQLQYYEVVGVPAVYLTHQEIRVQERGIA